MTDKPKDRSFKADMAVVFAALLVFSTIQAFAGKAASNWFAAGFVVSAICAFWEAGKNKGSSPDAAASMEMSRESKG